MSYEEDIENILKSFTDKEKEILINEFGIDPSNLQASLLKNDSYVTTRKRIVSIERRALKKLRPDEYIEPEGPECSFCYRAESEVKVMAKHNSGYNICSECIDSCLQVIKSGDVNHFS